jgi:hypothetical protein
MSLIPTPPVSPSVRVRNTFGVRWAPYRPRSRHHDGRCVEPPGGSTVTAAAGVHTTLDIEATTGALLVSPRTRPPNMLVPPPEPVHRTWSAPSIRAEPLSSPLAKHNLPALRQVAERLGRDITDRTSSPSPRRVSSHKQQRRAPLVMSRTNPIYKPLMCSITRCQPGPLHRRGRVGFTDSAPDRHTTKQQG